jgi:hypothetical protein
MPNYLVKVTIAGKSKIVRIVQASISDAEKEAKQLYPKDKIVSVVREGEDKIG